jgi:hypothetical protein
VPPSVYTALGLTVVAPFAAGSIVRLPERADEDQS